MTSHQFDPGDCSNAYLFETIINSLKICKIISSQQDLGTLANARQIKKEKCRQNKINKLNITNEGRKGT